ncbi:unnamed protein product, partial [marine sediment metagenome]
FLTDLQIKKASRLREHFRQYKSEPFKENLNINIKNLNNLEIDEIEDLVNILCNKINRSKFEEINSFLDEIQESLKKAQNDVYF